MSIPDPIVLLDARAKYVHPAFQMTRASTKTVFDAAGRMVTVPPNAIGWDHDPATGQARGYLAEPSATNLLLHSNDLTRGVWQKVNASVAGDATTGPDGNGMAKVVEDTNNNRHILFQSPITISDGSAVVSSFIAKAEERLAIQAWVMNASAITDNALCTFDLTNGSLRGQNAQGEGEFVDAGTTDLGGGFYRCWLAGRVGPGVTTARVEYRILPDANSDPLYQGDGTSGLYLGYAQAEEGSYPTSYIETGGATATRAGDSLVLSDLDDFPWWRSEQGTLLVDVDVSQFVSNGRILDLGAGEMALRWQANDGRIVISGSNVSSITIIRELGDTLGRSIIAFAWDEEEVQPSVAGILNTPSALSSPLTATSLGLGSSSVGTLAPHVRINRAVYYPHRIANADLQSLTAIQE